MQYHYARLFASIYDKAMSTVESRLLSAKRKKLLSSLSGEVLEIGSGTGTNFKYYSLNATVTAIEPSMAMLIKSEPKRRDNINLFNNGIYDESHKGKQFDSIVCTLVLCTIPNLDRAIETIITLLKPNGTLIILEHVKAKSNPRMTLLNIVNPFWKLIGEGCHLNRPTDILLKNSPLKLEYENYFNYKLDWYEAVYRKV